MSDLGPIIIGSGGQGGYAVTGGGGGGQGVPLQHVWFPPTEVGVAVQSPRLVRVWDRDWNFWCQLPGNSVEGGGEAFTATLPVKHELPAQLIAEPRPSYLTVDDADLRWVGRLHEWKILKAVRNGGCSECEHCQEQVMEIVWVKHPEARMMPLAAFS